MRWAKSCFVVASAAAIACSSSARPTPAVPPRSAPAAAPPAAWPDVARDARVEKSGARDAALVVAVERRGTGPSLTGVRVSGEDWARFFPTVLGIPRERVTTLVDETATPSTIASALRTMAARVAPGGRLWFVALGHAVVGEADVAAATRSAKAQVISVFDVVPTGDAETPARWPLPARAGVLPPITFSIATPTLLPGAARPALSYLLMGALRGWGDRDQDGRVTATEAADYVDSTVRLLSPLRRPERTVTARTDLACSELTTLSVAREPAPNVLLIAPRAPRGPSPSPERLAAAREAVDAADAQLALARESGSLKGKPAPKELRFSGEGERRQVEVVPMPNEVEATVRVRLEQAKILGGPTVPEAAPLLVEAGRLYFTHGRLDEAERVLGPVLEARCGADAAGHHAWETLLAISGWTRQTALETRLASMNCAYDEASTIAVDLVLRPSRGPADPQELARRLYSRAEEENDPTLARCTWSAVAEQYWRSWWRAPAQPWQVESALNGAYALRLLSRTDEAVALYRSYVHHHAAASPGESDSAAKARRAYVALACSSYFALAKLERRFLPGYIETCGNIDCADTRGASCADVVGPTELVPLGAAPGETERARRLSLAARAQEERAAWESTETARTERLREASEGYGSAEAAWRALVGGGDGTPDPAEAARRLAEAAVRHVYVDLAAGVEVADERVDEARSLARQARDVSIDERRADPAHLLVELADAVLAREQRAFVASGGRRGVATRAELRLEGEQDLRHVAIDDIPAPVATAIAARDEYLASVPATFDAGQLRYRLAYEAGRLQFVYGHLAEARSHLELPYTMQCGVGPVGHEAWLLLLSIAQFERDLARLSSLAADGAVCPADVETRVQADRMRKPIRGILVLEAYRQLQASDALPDAPERRALRREAAALFRQFVTEAPARQEAPEAARLAADLYAELGEDTRAVEMYRRFLDVYGGQARLVDVETAYQQLATRLARLGDYAAEARLLVAESEQSRLPDKTRAAAAQKARELRRDRDGPSRAVSIWDVPP